jgi:heat shock protein
MLFLRKNNNDYDVFNGLSVFTTSRLQTDAKETKEGYVFSINVAGVNKDNVKISYHDQYLTVAIENTKNIEDKEYLIREIDTRSCKRSFYLPDVDEASIKASLNDGVLTLNMMKETKKENKYIAIE